jgi:hypothetical protein
MTDKYFINCTDQNIERFAKALSILSNEPIPLEVDLSGEWHDYQGFIMQNAGDTSVAQVWEDEHCVLMVSVDRAITVLNIVSKSNVYDIRSIEV